MSQADQFIDRIVRLCHKKQPEALDRIFDNPVLQAPEMSEQVLSGCVASLQSEPDILAWWCGYMCSEINRSEDNDRTHLPMTTLARKLIDAGLLPYQDFMPYPGQRLVFLNGDLFETLPPQLQTEIQAAFDVERPSDEQFRQNNEAIRQELKG